MQKRAERRSAAPVFGVVSFCVPRQGIVMSQIAVSRIPTEPGTRFFACLRIIKRYEMSIYEHVNGLVTTSEAAEHRVHLCGEREQYFPVSLSAGARLHHSFVLAIPKGLFPVLD